MIRLLQTSRSFLSSSLVKSRKKLIYTVSTTSKRLESTASIKTQDNPRHISVTLVKADGEKVTVKASEGQSIYDAVADNNVDIDGYGACEGNLCCTTCHVVFSESDYERVGAPMDEELDMLETAYGLTNTSRLGCQIILTKALNPLEAHIPASTIDEGPAKPAPLDFDQIPLIDENDPTSVQGSILRKKIDDNLTVVLLFDPKHIEQLVSQDGKCPSRRSHRALLKYRTERPALYNDGGLFPENGENWLRQRTQFTESMLSKVQTSANIPKLDKISQNLVKSLLNVGGNNKEFDIVNFEMHLYKWALANSLSLFLETDIEVLGDDKVNRILQELDNALHAIDITELQSSSWETQPDECPHYKMLVDSQNFLYEFVEERIQLCHDNLGNESYLKNWLYVDKLDKKDIISFVIDNLMAGMHTTSYTAVFLLYHLTNNQEAKALLDEELNNLMSKCELITGDQLDKAQFLKNCLKETLRLNPVSVGFGRLTSDDNLVIGNFKIPKNVMIITQNQMISLSEGIFYQANLFKPERWSQYRNSPQSEQPSPFASLPFGFGVRSCIGQRIVELQIKILVARIFQHLQLEFYGPIPTKTTLINNIGGPITVSASIR